MPALFEGAVLLAQLGGVGFEAAAVLGELRRHVVEGVGEHGQLVVRHGHDAVFEVPARDLPCGLGERAYGRADAAREVYRGPRRGEEQQ